MYRYILFFLITVSLYGCFYIGGGNSQSDDSQQDPSGIWLGSQSIVGSGAYDMKTIIYNGRLVGISEDAGVLYSGTYEMSNDEYLVADGRDNSSTTYRLYDLYDDSNFFSIGLVAAHVEEQNRFSGSFQNDAGQEGELDAYYSSLYEKAVSIKDIEGERSNSAMNIIIERSGEFSGHYSGCSINGRFTVPEAGKNIFVVDFDLTGCSKAGSYDGLGIIMENNSGDPYFMGLTSNDNRMEALGFALDDLPASFKTVRSKTIIDTVTTELKEAADIVETASKTSVLGSSSSLPLESGNHDGETFGSDTMAYRYSGASYKNASFTGTKFYKVQTESHQCLSTGFSGSIFTTCTETVYYPSAISGSDFSGAVFSNASFGAADTSTYYTSVSNSNFTGVQFIGPAQTSVDKNKTLYIKPTGTDFSGSTFENYKFSINNIGNIFTGSSFINSVLSVSSNDNDLSGSSFTGGSLTFNNKAFVSNVTYDGVSVTVNVNDLDLEDADLSKLAALYLYKKIDLSGYDLSGASVKMYSNGSMLDGMQEDYEGSSFSGTNFSDGQISMAPYEYTVSSSNGSARYYSALTAYDINFSKANFSRTTFAVAQSDSEYDDTAAAPSFTKCNFTGANFKDADIGGSKFFFSRLDYTNLEGADDCDTHMDILTSYFGNAWWFDGTRCAAISIGTCIPTPFDTGLTYNEYLSGKDDIDKAAENIKKEAEDLIETGKSFIKDTASSVIKAVFHW